MNKRCILCVFLLVLLIVPPAALRAEGEGAEAADGAPADSFNSLTDKLLHSVGGEFGEEAGASVIAVLSIRNSDGRDSRLGNYLEERLVDLLISNTKWSVVERNQMKQLVQEWGYSLSGMLEDDSMYEIGSMAGADAVLVGSLTRIEQSVQVNLRIIEPESALVLGSVDSVLSEPRYLSMYLDVFDSETLTDEDFYIGRGRDFQKDRAFLESFFSLCRVMQEELGRADFLDGSFLDYLEASANVELKRGSRQNYTLRVRKDQFEARHLYNFFFSDGRSQTVWYYDEKSYGWHTNPYFQSVVEGGYDTFGVPDIYRDAVARSAAFSAPAGTLDSTAVAVDGGRIQCTGTGSTPEWALLKALMKAALVFETQLEVVTFRDDAGAIDFVAEYVSLENLEWLSGSITSQEVQATEDMYIQKLNIGD